MILEPFLAESTNPLLTAVVGLLLLIAGRKIFWLAVGVTGFAFGLGLAIRYLNLESPWVHMIIALLMDAAVVFGVLDLHGPAAAVATLALAALGAWIQTSVFRRKT